MTEEPSASMNGPPPMAMLPPAASPRSASAPSVAYPSRARAFVLVAGATLVGAMSVAGLVTAWNAKQRVQNLEQELVRRQQKSQDDATEARLAARQALDSVREANGKLDVLDERVAETQMQRSQVEDLIQSLSRSRDENVLADVESAIRVAMQQAALTGSTDPIATILRQSDDRLARLNNPRMERVRRAIARDLDKVRTAAVVDIPSLTIRLDEVVRQVDDLALVSAPERAAVAGRSPAAVPGSVMPSNSNSTSQRAVPVARTGGAASTAHAGAGRPAWLVSLQRAWDDFSVPFVGELRQAVRVTSIEHPEAMLITPDQSFFLRENVKLRLLNARLSVLSRQFDLAQSDLAQAQTAIDRYFDRNSHRVVAISDVLRQISAQARQVSFPRPDETLAAIATAVAGH